MKFTARLSAFINLLYVLLPLTAGQVVVQRESRKISFRIGLFAQTNADLCLNIKYTIGGYKTQVPAASSIPTPVSFMVDPRAAGDGCFRTLSRVSLDLIC